MRSTNLLTYLYIVAFTLLHLMDWRAQQQQTSLSNRIMSQHNTDLSVGRGNFLMLLISLLISGAVNPCTRFLRARPRLRTCCLSVSPAPSSSSSSSSSSDSSASLLVSVSSSYFLRRWRFFSAASLSDSNWLHYTVIQRYSNKPTAITTGFINSQKITEPQQHTIEMYASVIIG